MKQHESKIFDTSTVQGLKSAERFKARLNDKYQSVNVYAIGLCRVQIVGLKAIEVPGLRWPDGLQNY